MLRQPHDQIEAPVALEHQPGMLAADRDLDDALHIADGKPVARQGGAVELHRQHRQAGDLLGLDVGRARDFLR